MQEFDKLQETVLEERERREKGSGENVGIHVPDVYCVSLLESSESSKERNIQDFVPNFLE
jgi:hypothetical protein